MSGHLLEFAIILGFAVAFVALILALLVNIDYRITPFHLEILMLGLVVRRIPHDDIRSVGVRRVWPAEPWCNTLKPNNRRLVIERRSGRIKHLVISPTYRFVFRAALAEARQQYDLLRQLQPELVADPPGFWEQVAAQAWSRPLRPLIPALRKPLPGKPAREDPVPQYLSN